MNQNFSSSVDKIVEDDNIEFRNILNMIQASSIQYGTIQTEFINYSFTLPTEEQMHKTQITELGNSIQFDSKNEVTHYLLKNPKLIGIINNAIEQIRIYFPGEKLKLRVKFDPEIDSDEGTLFLLIVTKKEPEEAIELLDELNEKWWFEVKLKTDEKLIIEEEYE
jgi:hypothetical protein